MVVVDDHPGRTTGVVIVVLPTHRGVRRLTPPNRNGFTAMSVISDHHPLHPDHPDNAGSSDGFYDSRVRLSHLVDDYETLRTKTLRTLNEHVRRLSDARHAVTHGSPDVADEFISRAMDAIDRDIARLRDAEHPCACRHCAVR